MRKVGDLKAATVFSSDEELRAQNPRGPGWGSSGQRLKAGEASRRAAEGSSPNTET